MRLHFSVFEKVCLDCYVVAHPNKRPYGRKPASYAGQLIIEAPERRVASTAESDEVDIPPCLHEQPSAALYSDCRSATNEICDFGDHFCKDELASLSFRSSLFAVEI